MITQSQLKLLMDYVPETGQLIWRRRPEVTVGAKTFNIRYAGKPVGTTKSSGGYVSVTVDGVFYTAHRLIWLYIHGYFPPLIDHIDRDKTNNRLDNLRLATRTQNNFNRLQRPLVGVRKTPNGRWKARIKMNGKTVHLGVFDRQEDASDCYAKAAEKFYGMKPVYNLSAGSTGPVALGDGHTIAKRKPKCPNQSGMHPYRSGAKS